MKASYYQTPRTLRDSVFTYGSTTEPVARQAGYSLLWWFLVVVTAVGGALLTIFTGPAA